MFRERAGRNRSPWRLIGYLLCCLAVLALIWAGLGALKEQAAGEQTAMLEESLRRAAVQCYALEGRYPPDLDYIRENYGVDPDPGRYTVVYHCFASNLLPEITVLPKEGA